MNVGYADARGSIMMFCDSDDLYPDGAYQPTGSIFADHPEYDGVCGIFSTIDRKGNLIAKMQCGDDPAEITNELISGKLRTSFCTYASTVIVGAEGWSVSRIFRGWL